MIRPHRVGIAKYIAATTGATPTPASVDIAWFTRVTEDGIAIETEELSSETMNYLTGAGVYDRKGTGKNVHVKYSTYNFDKKEIAKYMHNALYDDVTKVFELQSFIGESFRDTSSILIMRPIDMGNTDAEDFVFYKTQCISSINLTYHGSQDQKYDLDFECYPIPVLNAQNKVVNKYAKVGTWMTDFLTKQGKFFTDSEIVEG